MVGHLSPVSSDTASLETPPVGANVCFINSKSKKPKLSHTISSKRGMGATPSLTEPCGRGRSPRRLSGQAGESPACWGSKRAGASGPEQLGHGDKVHR